MTVREATIDDAESIQTIARASMRSSYGHSLDDETIQAAVEHWYEPEELATLLEDDDALVVVAERDGAVVGFSQSELVGTSHDVGQIHWLHVDPDHRGQGIGVRLLVETKDELVGAGADEIRGAVLADNEDGNRFYEAHGFQQAGTREVDIDGETYTENVFVRGQGDAASWRSLEPQSIDGQTRYVSYGESERGSRGRFYRIYADEEGVERYGWFCGRCETADNAMDPMGRIECNECGNRRKATRWDASYL